MTPQESERLNKLCALIETEKDTTKFTELVRELEDLLDRKEQRLKSQPNPGEDDPTH